MWPKLEYVTCNFPRQFLPVVKTAIDEQVVTWGRSSGFCEAFTSVFYFADCKWELDELNEIVTGIRLIEGSIDPEVLTVAILKGKIDNS